MLHLVIEAYIGVPDRTLVLVSNWGTSEYGKKLKGLHTNNYPNIILQDAIYDTTVLDVIRSNADLYIHSHSRCGTAPSLVEAMHFNTPVLCYDVPANRATTQNQALYFSSVATLQEILRSPDQERLIEAGNAMYRIAKTEYAWAHIAQQYSKLFNG